MILQKKYFSPQGYVGTSDESEPSWLKPGLELSNFQLGLAQLMTFSIQFGNFPIKARKLAQ